MSKFVSPMLAVPGKPFDSSEFLFEVKWNGVRALAAHVSGAWRLWGRDLVDYTPRYPELAIVQRLPPGTIVDGELVVGQGGMPDFAGLLARHQLRAAAKIHHAGRNHPVTYVVFDVLEAQGRSLLGQPLLVRREILRSLVDRLQEPRLVFSEGVIGSGRAFFDQAVHQGQEGVMAKHLASR